MTVQPGEIAGFLGPSGAGKSTTIRILLGLLRADSGWVSARHPARHREVPSVGEESRLREQ